MGKNQVGFISFLLLKIAWLKTKKTQVEQNVLYDVCKLPLKANSLQPCVAFYKHNLANGTKNLQNHLINKHSYIEEVAAEIATHHPSKSVATLFAS